MSNRELDPEIPSIFVAQALKAPDTRWKVGPLGGWSSEDFILQLETVARLRTAVGDRINTFEGVDAKPPYIVWSVREDPNGTVRAAKSRGGEIMRKRAIVSIKRVDVFISGRGSYSPARLTYLNLMSALVSVPATLIYGTDGYLGVVTQTRFKREIRNSQRADSGALVTNFGFELEVTYENN